MEVIGLLRELHSKQQEIAGTHANAGANVTPVDAFEEVNCIIYRGIARGSFTGGGHNSHRMNIRRTHEEKAPVRALEVNACRRDAGNESPAFLPWQRAVLDMHAVLVLRRMPALQGSKDTLRGQLVMT